MTANCSYQEVTDTLGTATFKSVQYICTKPPSNPPDLIYQGIFLAMFIIGLAYLTLKFLKNRSIHNSERETDNGGKENV